MNYKLKYLKYKIKYLQMNGGSNIFNDINNSNIKDVIELLINYINVELNKEYSIQQDGYDSEDSTDDIKCKIKINSHYYSVYNDIKIYLEVLLLFKISNNNIIKHYNILYILNNFILILNQLLYKEIELTLDQTVNVCSKNINQFIESLNNIKEYYKKELINLLISELKKINLF